MSVDLSRKDLAEFAGARVVVTGGLGFIGSALAARLVALGSEVLLIDSLAPNYGGNLFNIAPIADRVRVEIADIRDTARVKPLLPGCDYLFNLAGQTSHLDSMHDPVTDLDINCRAQLTLLEACRADMPASVVVFASARGRSMAGRTTCRSMRGIRCVPSMSTASTRWRARPSHPLSRRLRHQGVGAAPDQHLWPAHAHQGCASDLRRRLAAAGARGPSRSRSGAASSSATSPMSTTPSTRSSWRR